MGRQEKSVKRQTRKLSRLLVKETEAAVIPAGPLVNQLGADVGLLIFEFACPKGNPSQQRYPEVCRAWFNWWEERRNYFWSHSPAELVHAALVAATPTTTTATATATTATPPPPPLPLPPSSGSTFMECVPAVEQFVREGGSAAALRPLLCRSVRYERNLLNPAKGKQRDEDVFQFIKTLVEKFKVDRNAPDGTGRNVLHLALLFRDYQLATKLLKFGVDCNATDKLRRLPMHYPARDGSQEMLTPLLKKAGVESLTKRDYQGQTPLDMCKLRHNPVYMHLLHERQELLSCRDEADEDYDSYDDE